MRLVGSFRRLDEFDSTKYTHPSPIAIVVLMILPPRYSHFLRPVCFSIANKLSLQTLAVSCVPLESYQYGVPLNLVYTEPGLMLPPNSRFPSLAM